MALNNLLNATTKNFGDIIKGDKSYEVPLFQRDYSWKESNWDDLWQDIINAKKSDNNHYMGSLVLITKNSKVFNIIDGQQRLTTLSLLSLAVIDIFNNLIEQKIAKKKNEERRDILMTNYIGFKNTKSLLFNPKLKLNQINDPFYSTYLVQFDKAINPKKLSTSNKLIYSAYEFFKDKIKKEIFDKSGKIDDVIDFIEFISDSLQFIQITVTDDLDAYLVFETLNDRGLDLTVTDLFKNYLFSRVAVTSHTHIKNKWDNILKTINFKDFSIFLRYYWISKYNLITEKELFKEIKQKITNEKEVIEILTDLEKYSELFMALSNPNDEFWNSHSKETKSYLSELSLFGTRQPYPLLMSAYVKFNSSNFTQVLKMARTIAFRYTIISELRTNQLEQVYSKSATKIFNGQSTNPSMFFSDLSPLYVNDDLFQQNFASKTIKTTSKNKLVRYILYTIENHINQGHIIDYEKDKGTIEHILPENATSIWNKDFIQKDQKEYVYRLGNYTILESKINKDADGKLINEKIKFYKKSSYSLSKEFDLTEWNPTKLKIRQTKLAKYASQIWRIQK
jgi:uncharacterized protein with ParB-like and HNH nuclease domain